MCLPPEVVMMAMTAAQMKAQQDAQVDTANKQAAAINQNNASARMDAERMQEQQYEASAGEMNVHALQAHKAMATFDAIASEAGSGGATAQRGAAAMGIQQGQDLATVTSNAQKGQTEIGMGNLAANNKAKQQIASIAAPASQLGQLLTIAGSGYSTWVAGTSRAPADTPTKPTK